MPRSVDYDLFKSIYIGPDAEQQGINQPICVWLREHVQEIDPAAYHGSVYPTTELWKISGSPNWGRGTVVFHDSVPDDIITFFKITWG